jgi:hypothetical protein
VARYAEGTTVTVESSRGEIMGILGKHGVKRMVQGVEPEADTIQFELGGRIYRLRVIRPTQDEIFKLFPNHRDTDAKMAQEWRRRWRATVLLLKAKLEFADGETSTVERELLPYMLLDDGQTVEDAVIGGNLMLAAGAKA